MRPVYSLRFLTEALRARQEPVASFRDSLGKLVLDILNRDNDILSRKVAVESAGLLSAKASEAVFLQALSTGNNWITDTAFAACRYQQRLSKSVEDALFNLIAGRGQLWIMLPDRDFRFAVGIADAFNGLRRRFNALSVDVWASVAIGLIVGSILGVWMPNPLLAMATSTILCNLYFLAVRRGSGWQMINPNVLS
jgi:hypothetical protein